MDRSAQSRLRAPVAMAALLAMLSATPAAAQLGDTIPHASYYVAVQAFYSGDYRDAERALRRETQRGVRTTQARWIDAICYHAMLGEVLYQQGRNANALAEFDQACQLILAYPNWLLQVKFQMPPRPDTGRSRRVPPWGRSQRPFTLGQFSESEQVLIGELNATRVLQQGGAYQQAMFWRVDVDEVIRTSALAIRRRSELLGPLAEHDRISKDLSDTLSRGNLSPPNHWSVAWIDLLRGLAQAGIGKLDQADTLLDRAVVVDGRFDHPLTCVALLEQGRIAMLRGDTRRAATLLAEAGFSAYYYKNWDALTDSMWLGWINHMASGGAGMYPPLESVVAWAQLNRLQHTAAKLRLAQAESQLWLNQLDAAGSLLEESSRRIGRANAGLLRIHQLYLQANLHLMRGQFGPGGTTLGQAVVAQAAASLRNFQITRTNQMYDGRAISPRIAVDLYAALLADPTGRDWAFGPLDAMAVLQTPQDAAFDRWFIAALERKDVPLALEAAEMDKRRRFLAALPLGGRLLALRTILEAPERELSREALLQRQQILANFPAYRDLGAAGVQMAATLRTGPVLARDAADAKTLNAQYDAWEKNATHRQQLLMQLAPRRVPTAMEFPPLLSTAELQQSLGDGEALIEFHSVGGNLHGFLVTREATHTWPVGDLRGLRNGTSELLRTLGNYGANRMLSADEIASDEWRNLAEEAYTAIFRGARLDLAKTESLIIIPDDLLWYLPFDTLVPAGALAPVDEAAPVGDMSQGVLAERVPIRYGPTAALAVARPLPLRRPQHTGLAVGEIGAGDNDAAAAALVEQLEDVVAGPLRLPTPLPEPPHQVAQLLDGLIVLEDVDSERMTESGWLPLPKSRGAANEVTVPPVGGPQRVVITGFATAAEQGLKGPRRGAARGMRPGGEVFQTLCGMMAGGARIILLSRWRTGGRTNLELVREFVQELPDTPAAEAWQRACLLARETPLDAESEPRLRGLGDTGELPTADHPFFWAGYMLVDTSPQPGASDESDDAMPPARDLPPPDAKAMTKPTAAGSTPEQPAANAADDDSIEGAPSSTQQSWSGSTPK